MILWGLIFNIDLLPGYRFGMLTHILQTYTISHKLNICLSNNHHGAHTGSLYVLYANLIILLETDPVALCANLLLSDYCYLNINHDMSESVCGLILIALIIITMILR